MGTSYAALRRQLAQRMNMYGGDITTGNSATTSDLSSSNTLVDVNRTEPDSEWDASWIVLNPGSADQVTKPTIWRRISPDGGWTQSNGTAIILGTWPAPYASGVPAGTPYELYKVFKPGDWLQAVNFSLLEAYPHRHRPIDIEVAQDSATRIIDYGFLAKAVTSVATPTAPLVATELADGKGAFQPGVYTFACTYYNDFGETLASPTSTLTVANANSRVQFAQITGVPATVRGVNYYSSLQPNDTTMDLLATNQAIVTGLPSNVTPPVSIAYEPGFNQNGTVYAVQFPSPNPLNGVAPPQFNTTTIDFFRLHHILQRTNPGVFPELYNELGPGDWKRLGGTKILLMYLPINQFALKFLCTTQVPTLSGETDISQEPAEMIYWGGEWYLWNLLIKISQIVNTAWEKLATDAQTQYNKFMAKYKQDLPRDMKYVPKIRPQY